MTGEINSTYERDINDIVLEYFNYANYHDSFEKFKAELVEKGKQISKQEFNQNSNIDQQLFFDYFRAGKKKEFFDFWNKVLSEKLRSEDTVCQKLEFYCHIYFATYIIRQNYENKDLEQQAMQEFREFLESKGAKLSKSTEFVQFYALPYVPNPRDHPSFAELFQDSWVPGLEMRLRRFFELTIGNTGLKEPRMLTLYRSGNNASEESGKDNLKKLQARVVESEKRSANSIRRLNQVQVDYHALIGISAELVDLLEGSLQGVPVSPSHLQHVCQRLLASQQHRLQANQSISLHTNGNTDSPRSKQQSPRKQFSYDLSRPGTASKLLRQSIQTYPQLAPGENGDQKPVQYKSLNFNKVREDIETGDDKLRSLLLQALRWRLTKTDITTRDKLLIGVSQHDLLGLTPETSYHTLLAGILNGEKGDATTRQYLVRFFNAVATLSRGRNYLASKNEVCGLLMKNIQGMIEEESILRENMIGALQKLSLRRSIQTYMITNGMIEWLMSLLESTSSNLSDYTLDYSVALLMNLCLRTLGKKRCVDHKKRILEVLSKMLNTFNTEIASYVNGALYSILIMPEIREEARDMKLEETLKNFIKEDSPDLNRQIEYIINQLNSTDQPNLDAPSDDEEDDDEEDPDVLEVELDKDECVEIGPDDLQGENLLSPKYTTFPSKPSSAVSGKPTSNEPPTLSRPVTPGTYMARKTPSAKLQQHNESVDIERPPTRSGSKQANNNSRPATASSSSARQKPQQQQSIENSAEYQNAFGEKPRILRTPHHPNSGSGVASNNGDADENKRKESLSGPRPSSGQPKSSSNGGTRRSRQSITNSTK